MPPTIPLSPNSKDLLNKFNICLERYSYYADQIKVSEFLDDNKDAYIKSLSLLQEKIESPDDNVKMLKYVLEKLEKFSDTYDVNVSIIDDLKIVHFIALYLLNEDNDFNDKTKLENNIVLVVLHKIMCTTLLAYEPLPLLETVKKFIKQNTYEKFLEEYGDIGYYHMIKSIYLMQTLSVKAFIDEDYLKKDDIVASYFKDT